jgi:thiol-disulfide isomerase/thioredoxin
MLRIHPTTEFHKPPAMNRTLSSKGDIVRKSLLIALLLGFASLLIGIACAEKSPAEKSNGEAVSSSEAGSQTGSSKENSPASSSKEAYAMVMQEIKDIERSAMARQDIDSAIDKIEGKLLDFIKDYPRTPEAQDAEFQLGVLFAATQKPDKAIKHLKTYIESKPDVEEEKIAYAHFSLAESYKNHGSFDLAKKQYRYLIDNYSEGNTKMIAMARSNLEDMDVIKQLAIGGEPIPFDVKDLEGKPLSIDKFKGKVVLLDFWATWCKPCIAEMPNVKRIYDMYQKEGFEIIGISLDSKRTALESYIKRNDIKWPQYFDGAAWNNEVAQKYKVRSIPATFLLDRNGKIRYKSVRGSQLTRAVEQLVKEEVD